MGSCFWIMNAFLFVSAGKAMNATKLPIFTGEGNFKTSYVAVAAVVFALSITYCVILTQSTRNAVLQQAVTMHMQAATGKTSREVAMQSLCWSHHI